MDVRVSREQDAWKTFHSFSPYRNYNNILEANELFSRFGSLKGVTLNSQHVLFWQDTEDKYFYSSLQ